MPANETTDRAAALAWLAGRLHWERLLQDLQDQGGDLADAAPAPPPRSRAA